MKIITLTTDFGSENWFVGTMKGVIAKIAPQARVIDLNHGVSHFDVAEAAFSLVSSYNYFPHDTIHVVVVDPGVGTARRPVIACGDRFCFIAPDNGVLSFVAGREKHMRWFHADRPEYFLPHLSDTFHGRDIFAPLAAHLARGTDPVKMGSLITDPAMLEGAEFEETRSASGAIKGRIMYIDCFGNLITNISSSAVDNRIEVEVSPLRPTVSGILPSYDSVPVGEAVVVCGSSGFLEVAVNQGNAQKEFNCKKGDEIFVYVTASKKG
ncbi:MAG: SAM-dependent chlorinase/fluorinase [Candidatus Auribacterota bacterium]